MSLLFAGRLGDAADGEDDLAGALVVYEEMDLRGEFSRPVNLEFASQLADAWGEFFEFFRRVLRTEAAVVASALGQAQHANRPARTVFEPENDLLPEIRIGILNFDLGIGDMHHRFRQIREIGVARREDDANAQ